MWFSSWLAKQFRSSSSGLGSHRKPSGCRPQLEFLEGRTVPSAGYRFTTISDPNGPGDMVASGINDRGDVVGSSNNEGFLLSGGRYTPLDAPGAVVTYANGISDRGQIVGSYYSPDPQNSFNFIQHGFLLSNGHYTTLDDPKAAGTTVAQGINNSGQIVGYYADAGGAEHGFLLVGGGKNTRSAAAHKTGAAALAGGDRAGRQDLTGGFVSLQTRSGGCRRPVPMRPKARPVRRCEHVGPAIYARSATTGGCTSRKCSH